MRLFYRLTTYIAVFLFYLALMDLHAPIGITWLDWHAHRIFNAVEFLKVNGYFYYYGYSIWDSCENCSLDSSNWQENIYVSKHIISLLPYALINHFGGQEYLFLLGPMLDKLVVFACAALIAELIIQSIKGITEIPLFLIGVITFSLFAVSPWAYKMIIASWPVIYFLMFFLLGMVSFRNGKFMLGCISFFISGVFNYQFAIAIAGFYSLIVMISFLLKPGLNSNQYFPLNVKSLNQKFLVIFFLVLPTFLMVFTRIILLQSSELISTSGSSLLYRIGISGDDIHNGGLLGAIQFLGGNRITQCLGSSGLQDLSGDLSLKIAMFNCIMSISGMGILSLISIIGVYFLIKDSSEAKSIFLPLIFSLLIFISVLQQSLSAHLMGYSFIFAGLFSAGLVYIMSLMQQKLGSLILGLVFSIPCIFGVLILSVRISMLTGVNG